MVTMEQRCCLPLSTWLLLCAIAGEALRITTEAVRVQEGDEADSTGSIDAIASHEVAAEAGTSWWWRRSQATETEAPTPAPPTPAPPLPPRAGVADEMFVYGPPGPFSPTLRNSRSANGCWPGIRIVNQQKRLGGLLGTWVDGASTLTLILGYVHPWIDLMVTDVQTHQNYNTPCEYNPGASIRAPSGFPSFVIHLPFVYKFQSGPFLPGRDGLMSNLGVVASYEHDPAKVYELAREHDWRLIESIHHPGQRIDGGPQVMHLIQEPNSLECILTFKGSIGVRDWMSNLKFPPKHFCGLVDEDETCGPFARCKTRGGSFVHGGFRDHLRRITRTAGFQNDIRPKLPQCAKFTLVGHSLGAATAELFAACLSKAPQPGQFGYDEDYKYINFTKAETPTRLPEKINFPDRFSS